MMHRDDQATRRAKNIAAVVYLIVLTFLVGGSYIHQHKQPAAVESATNPPQSEQ